MTLCAYLVAMLSVLVTGTDDSPGKETLKPLHFRLEVVTDEVSTVVGRMEASKPEILEYDQAVLDLDGDGEPEETVTLEKDSRRNSSTYTDVRIRFPLEGMDWSVEFFGSQASWLSGKVYLHWTLSWEDLYLFFINGQTHLHPTAEAAAQGKAIRLGSPFAYSVKTSTRGPDALVNVGLKDDNGATLRVARRKDATGDERVECNIQVVILKDGEESSSMQAEYG